MYAFMGKILRVNLSEGKVSEEDTNKDWAEKYLGGSGLATKYLYDEVKAGVDPLGAENKLIFMTGCLTSTPSPSTGRYSVVAKSPLTDFWAQSNSAGFWGSDFKKTGFDGIIFEGISPKPVYLVVTDGKAELKDAADIWGKSVPETTSLLKEKLGKKYNVACIGIGGENLVRYAAIMNDEHRAAGRCGMGAVMGSKRLKAIAVNGSKTAQIANQAAFTEVAKKQYALLDESMMKIGMETFGTTVVLDMVNVRGGLPTRNWQTGVFHNVEKINATALNETLLVDRKNCFACPIKCGRVTEIKTGPYAGNKGEGPEYETIGACGCMCDIDDLAAITMAHYLCDDYGLDTISTGSTIGFAMECYEKGILTKADTGGLEINFGDAAIMIELIHKIAKREGVGDLLAEGTKRMAKKLGKGSERFAMHVKGLEMPCYDPRAAKITGLGFMVANRGGDHITGYIQAPAFLNMPFLIVEESTIEDVFVENPKEAKVVKDLEDALTFFDCAGGCKFMGLSLAAEEWVELIAHATGWKFGVDEFRKTGERVVNLARAYNIREGLTPADDSLPKRLLEDPLPEGPAAGHVNDPAPLLEAYYEFRGWDKATGKPTPEKLRELGLEDLIPDMWGK